uniref:ATP synthase F0 subunit 8 n=1 Tax=Lophogaster typicus TaxID=419538 RepID=UPI002176A4A4|nr:ATP synthase F0 subunit 8 [Lophogaster typicus]UUL70714.1 ATP synthase F0 subunit 8 [Lophogaster typicus]
MPQMSPMMWVVLLFFFNFSFLMFFINMYYFKLNFILKGSGMSSSKVYTLKSLSW